MLLYTYGSARMVHKQPVPQSYRLLEDKGVEPVTVNDIVTHLRLDVGNDFALDVGEVEYISGLIKAAREQAENLTGRCFTEQRWALYLDRFPAEIRLLKPPIYEFGICYRDSEGQVQWMDPAQYKDAADPTAYGTPLYDGGTVVPTELESNKRYILTHEFVPVIRPKTGFGWPGLYIWPSLYDEPLLMANWPYTYPLPEAVLVTFRCGMYKDAEKRNPPETPTPFSVKEWIKRKVGELYDVRERSNMDRITTNTFIDNLLDPYIIKELSYKGW